jgi:hypothetical protein
VVLLQRFGQLDAVADGDVADEVALADHDPGELVQGVGSSPASGMLSVGLEALEAVGVDGGAGLGEHLGLALPQQPRIARSDHLSGHQQRQTAAQLIPVVASGRGASPQR